MNLKPDAGLISLMCVFKCLNACLRQTTHHLLCTGNNSSLQSNSIVLSDSKKWLVSQFMHVQYDKVVYRNSCIHEVA